MSNQPATASDFRVHCGYCGGEHMASATEGFYAGTYSHGYGPFYNVLCEATVINGHPVQYGVHAQTNTRV